MLPEYIGSICDADIPAITILAAMGDFDKIECNELNGKDGGYWGLYVIHANCSGILKKIIYSDIASKCLRREYLFKPLGSEVHTFSNSRDAIGLAFFKFTDKESRDAVLRDFTGEHVKLDIQ